MKIIDFHQHLWIGRDHSGATPDPDGEEMLRAMDRHGIERVVLHAIPTSCVPHTGDNEAVLRAVRRHPDRFIGSVYICPKDVVGARDALVRYHGEGFKCVKILPFFNAVYIDDVAYTPVFEKIAELGLPVMIHMGPSGPRPVPGLVDSRCNHPLYLTNVAARFPKTKFVIAHLAQHWFWDAVMLHISHQNVYLETSTQGAASLSYRFLKEWELKGPKDRVSLLRIDNRVMFGLDLGPCRYAEYLGYWRQFIEEVGKPQYLETFFYKTAARVLGLAE